jgi:integrase
MRQIEAPPIFRKANDWLRPDEDQKVLDACMTKDEFLAVFLLRFTGLRASEAVNLRGRTWSGTTASYGFRFESRRRLADDAGCQCQANYVECLFALAH